MIQLYDGLQYFKKIFEYYDFEKFINRSQKDIRISFNESIFMCRYGDIYYGASEETYLKSEEMLLSFLCDLVKAFSDSSIILHKYSVKWIKQKKISHELYEILKQNKIKNQYDTLIVRNNFAIIRLFAQSILRYNSFIQFLFPQEKVIVSVTDHMDIFVSAQDNLVLRKVYDTVKKFNNMSGEIILHCEDVN